MSEASNERTFFMTGDGCRIAYRHDGPTSKPTLVLSNSIATTHRMWDGEMEALTEHFRVLRYDARGEGASDSPAGAYSLDRLGRDVLELLDALRIDRVRFCGLSLGGFVGQWLAIRAPERIERLVLAHTASYLGPAKQFDDLVTRTLHAEDMSEMASWFLGNWFPARMLAGDDPAVAPFRATLLATRPQGLAGNFAAVRDADMRRTVALVEAPTLVVNGQFDKVTLPSDGERIAATIHGARLVSLPAVHLSNVECRPAFLDAVIPFLERAP